MPRPAGAAEPARFALLGLLLGGPQHGYDLARHFVPGSALGEVVRLSPSHLYAILGRMERDGLIAGERQEVGAHPPRHVYHLTASGREAVLRWIDKPVEHPRDMRIDFPLKLYVARQLGPGNPAERLGVAAALVGRQRALFSAYAARLERQAPPSGPAEDAAFIALMRAGRLGRLRAALAWLDGCADLQPTGR